MEKLFEALAANARAVAATTQVAALCIREGREPTVDELGRIGGLFAEAHNLLPKVAAAESTAES